MKTGQESCEGGVKRPAEAALCKAWCNKLVYGFKQDNALILLIFLRRSLGTGQRMGQYKALGTQGGTRHSVLQSMCNYKGNEIQDLF